MNRTYIFFCFICVCLSCYFKKHAKNKSVLPAISTNKITLTKQAWFDIPLPDDLVVDGETQIYYSTADSLLFFFDPFKNRLLGYSFSEEKFTNEIAIRGELPNKLKVTGMWVHNLDTIALYNYSNKQLCLANRSGKIFKSLRLAIPKNKDTSTVWYPSPVVANNSPAVIYEGQIFLTGYVSGEGDAEKFEGRCINSVVSLKDNPIKFMTPYTEVYRKQNYGGFYFRIPYATYNNAKGTLLISLPASHEVIEVDLSSKLHKLINLSPPFPIDIPAIDEPKEALAEKKMLGAEHYATNFSYKNIIYHPYKNVYLRILENPVPDDDLDEDRLGMKRRTILIYNADFHYMGQCQLDQFLSTQNYFVSPNGIFFLKNNNRQENVAQYVYYQFQ